jgi:hypothetical protein
MEWAVRIECMVPLPARLPIGARAPYFELLGGIFGPLPFRSVAANSAWLERNSNTVPAIARRIYDERAFHDLPFLADALEDAGCTDAEILGHCRQGGEHVRGCRVVDLILGKS